MGSIYTNAYEAERKLRKQCLQKNSPEAIGEYCQYVIDEKGYDRDATISNVVAGSTHLYFKSYTADVLVSEIELAGINPKPLPGCIKRFYQKSEPHKDARSSAMEPKNMVSAGVLMEIYDGGFLSFNYKNYTTRLNETFPAMFSPSSRSESLRSFVEDKLGDDFDYSNNDGRGHANIMDAFNALYNNDSGFKSDVDTKVDQIKKSYGKSLKDKLAGLCSKDPLKIQDEYPAIFKQAILDMNENERIGSNEYLCKFPKYYDPAKYDSDCDGESDKEDPSPNDPFTPDSEQSHSGRNVSDPPYGSEYDYEVKRNSNGVVDLKTTLYFETHGMNETERTAFINKVKTCNSGLEKDMNDSFEDLKKSNPSYNGKLNTKIKIEFGDYFSPSFDVHKCYCSDCNNRVKDPESTLGMFYLDHTKCWDDLTDKQKEAVKKVFPGGSSRWRNRANAANLNTDVTCRTIKHEILHRFGLPDEYSDRNSYPYNRIACSIMGVYNYNDPDEIKGRHLESILSPESCQ
tara:strand:+ start:92699 stop:94243 length:1545 start_codon:yes stop_codon:yes gene_type:complete